MEDHDNDNVLIDSNSLSIFPIPPPSQISNSYNTSYYKNPHKTDPNNNVNN